MMEGFIEKSDEELYTMTDENTEEKTELMGVKEEHEKNDENHHSFRTEKNSFSSSRTVKNSPLEKAEDNSSFVCTVCCKTFSQKRHLTHHMRIHTREGSYTCPQCGKSFKHKRSLTNHMKCHTGDGPYTCPQCDKTYTSKANLEKHIRVHTGEKPFKCTQCDKSFPQRGHLKYHIRVRSLTHDICVIRVP